MPKANFLLVIFSILGYAHELGFYTSVITNGLLLQEKALELSRVVNLTWVSLDYDSDYHRAMRGSSRIFEKALNGIQCLKAAGGPVAINCVLSKLNVDAVFRMGNLAKKYHVKLAFDPMEVFSGYNDQYTLSLSEREKAFGEIANLKAQGYPILNSYEYASNHADLSYSCAQPLLLLDVSASGDIKNPSGAKKMQLQNG